MVSVQTLYYFVEPPLAAIPASGLVFLSILPYKSIKLCHLGLSVSVVFTVVVSNCFHWRLLWKALKDIETFSEANPALSLLCNFMY